jgi:hypothetical protein
VGVKIRQAIKIDVHLQLIRAFVRNAFNTWQQYIVPIAIDFAYLALIGMN